MLSFISKNSVGFGHQITGKVLAQRWPVLLAFLAFMGASSVQAQSWNWQGTADGWTGAGGCSITAEEDHLSMSITGGQPHIQSPSDLGISADDYESITVALRNLTAAEPCQLKWFDEDNQLLGSVDIPVDVEMEESSVYTVNLSDANNWSGSSIGKFRLRGPAGLNEGVVE